MDWELGIGRCKLVYREWINNKALLQSSGNYSHYPVINHHRKEDEKECVCVYIIYIKYIIYTIKYNI